MKPKMKNINLFNNSNYSKTTISLGILINHNKIKTKPMDLQFKFLIFLYQKLLLIIKDFLLILENPQFKNLKKNLRYLSYLIISLALKKSKKIHLYYLYHNSSSSSLHNKFKTLWNQTLTTSKNRLVMTTMQIKSCLSILTFHLLLLTQTKRLRNVY